MVRAQVPGLVRTSSASCGSGTPSSATRARRCITFAEDVDYVYPHRCWTCMVPCLIREDMVVDEVDGQLHTYCHEI